SGGAFTGPVPDTNRRLRAPRIPSAGVKPIPVGRPGDFGEIAIVYGLGIGGKAPLEGRRVIDLPRSGIGKADPSAAPRGVHGGGEGLLAPAGGDGSRLRRIAGCVPPQLAVIRCRVERARTVEGCTIGRLAAIVLVLGDELPIRQAGPRSPPHPQAMPT